MATRRILLIGGTGVFGQRLARHVATVDGLALTLTSRDADKARAVAAEISAGGARQPVDGIALDHRTGFDATLANLKPWLVIDASGPFQGASYAVPLTALISGAHVIDLADARDYLAGYEAALDATARAAGLTAIAGASSTPALSAAAVAALTHGWQRIDTIDIAITPGGQSDVGRAVIEAILSYAGQPVPIWRDGCLSRADGWIESRRVTVPGLGSRRVALVETADAERLGPRHRVQSRVAFYAGLESRIEQSGLMALARLRRRGWIGGLTPLIPVLLAARRVTQRLTSDRGGMLVSVTGLDARGDACSTQWSLLAEHGDGPYVPVLPAAAAVRALLADGLETGAHVGTGPLPLAAIEAEMKPYAITTARQVKPRTGSVFATALGAETFAALPARVRTFHSSQATPVWTGWADIDAGTGFLARLIGWVIGLPRSGRDLLVTVTVDRPLGDASAPLEEIWTRNFAGQRFSSRLSAAGLGAMTETFGPIALTLQPSANRDGLSLPVAGWRVAGVAMPRWLAPRSQAREFTGADGRFHFDVEISLPLVGRLVHYRGWLSERPH